MKNLNLLTVGVFTLSLYLSAGCAQREIKIGPKEEKNRIPLVGKFEAIRYRLENGLNIIVVEDHSSPTFAYHTWFKVGSRNETPKYTGLAHLFEHMMFKGTKTYKDGEFDRILESAGAEGENAFTNRDYTAYIQELPSSQLELIMKLESDRMVNLVVDENSFKTEREVVQNERRFRTENNPEGLMYQEMFELAFTQHPYHWPVIGYEEDLNRMTAKDAVDFYKSYYSPNHATVIVTGDVDPARVYSLAKKYYGDLKPQTVATHDIAQEPEQTASRRKTMKLNIQVEKLMMGYRIPELAHADTPAFQFVETALASGKSSRLHRALVETGIATSVEAYGLDDKDPSLLMIGVNLQKGKKAAQAETVVLRELARLAKDGMSASEMERVRNRLEFDYYESFSSNSSLANTIGHYETLLGDFESGIAIFEKAKKTTSQQVQETVRKYLDPKNRSVIIGVQK